MRRLGLLTVFLLTTQCVKAPVVVTAPDRGAASDHPADIVAVFNGCGTDANGARFMPRDSWLCALTPSLALVGAMMRDVEQKLIDQQVPDTLPPIIRHTRMLDERLCAVARQPDAYAEIVRSYADGGNPPHPYYQPAWLPVALQPDDPASSEAKCPTTADSGHLCLFGQLALQPEPAPVVIVAPGLFDSQRQDYVQRAGAALFAQGYGVLLLDMRDHGHTLRTQPWAHATLGLFEGHDLLAAGRRLTQTPGCAKHAADKGVGLLGFSAGGLATIHAYALDLESGSPVFSAGAVALSPLLDPRGAVESMEALGDDGEPAACSIFTMLSVFGPDSGSRCLAEGSIRHLFMALVRRRFASLAAAQVFGPTLPGAPQVTAYFDAALRAKAPYPGHGPEDIVGWTDPDRLAQRLGALRPTRGGGKLHILSSVDDPVVGHAGMRTLVDRLGGEGCIDDPSAAPVCPLLVQSGGHASFSVISPGRIRALLAHVFDPADARARVAASDRR